MAINGHRNKPCGPGRSTRRLHQGPRLSAVSGGGEIGSTMAEDLIRYDILAQDALRGVVRKVLAEVSRTGLPGEHHFYIGFATRAPGVRVSSRLLAQYPEEMTIVLQHQYYDLTVTEHAFDVR